MFIHENVLGMKSKQADITAVFLHAVLGDDEHGDATWFQAAHFMGCSSSLPQEKSSWLVSKA